MGRLTKRARAGPTPPVIIVELAKLIKKTTAYKTVYGSSANPAPSLVRNFILPRLSIFFITG